jgi:hypothetical protein
MVAPMTTDNDPDLEAQSHKKKKKPANVGTADRIVSAVTAAGVLAFSLWRITRNPWRAAFAALVPPLVVRAASGRSLLYRVLGVSTAGKRRK